MYCSCSRPPCPLLSFAAVKSKKTRKPARKRLETIYETRHTNTKTSNRAQQGAPRTKRPTTARPRLSISSSSLPAAKQSASCLRLPCSLVALPSLTPNMSFSFSLPPSSSTIERNRTPTSRKHGRVTRNVPRLLCVRKINRQTKLLLVRKNLHKATPRLVSCRPTTEHNRQKRKEREPTESRQAPPKPPTTRLSPRLTDVKTHTNAA